MLGRRLRIDIASNYRVPYNIISVLFSSYPIVPCKAKRLYLFTCIVSIYRLLTLQSNVVLISYLNISVFVTSVFSIVFVTVPRQL